MFDFNVIERGSAPYKEFIKKLEKNYALSGTRLSVCLLCWGFIPAHLKKRHLEHEPFIVTASFFKNEEAFVKIAKENGKISGNGTRVITFKDACVFTCGPNATKHLIGGTNYGQSDCFGGG